jgi:flagellar hook-basal body complex protein FliE
MASLPPKKGPRMTRACSPQNPSQDDAGRLEFEEKLNAFTRRVEDAVSEARNKMTDAEVKQADLNAAAILKSASDAESLRRKRA